MAIFYTYTLFILLISISAGLLAAAGVFPDSFYFQMNTPFTNEIENMTQNYNMLTGGQVQTPESYQYYGQAAAFGSFAAGADLFVRTFIGAVTVAGLLMAFGVPWNFALLLATPVYFIYIVTIIQLIKPFKQME
jgi:hypothetical protein